MVRLTFKDSVFAMSLAAIAGYVDAVGFLKAGGFFVSFMSGNSTRLAVGAVTGTPSASFAAGLIGCFIVGVMTGTLVSGRDGDRTRLVLLVVAALLAAAALSDALGAAQLGIFIAAAAMGAENATFARDGDVQIGLTYMTGTLVKFGQRLTRALQGRARSEWLPFLMLWCGLIGGGLLGALAFKKLGFGALWFAVVITGALSLYSPKSTDAH